MPANLPPQYFEAEKHYRLAKTPEEKVEALEAMLAIMPKHKGTDKLRAELRTKIAKFIRTETRIPRLAIARLPKRSASWPLTNCPTAYIKVSAERTIPNCSVSHEYVSHNVVFATGML